MKTDLGNRRQILGQCFNVCGNPYVSATIETLKCVLRALNALSYILQYKVRLSMLNIYSRTVK